MAAGKLDHSVMVWATGIFAVIILINYAASHVQESVVGKVAEIDALIVEIASSAQEQAQGLNEVNTAVNQMDQVTQQNAAMVEQTTAATHSLKGQTLELVKQVATFSISARQKAAAPATPTPTRVPPVARPLSRPGRQPAVSAPAARGNAAAALKEKWEEF